MSAKTLSLPRTAKSHFLKHESLSSDRRVRCNAHPKIRPFSASAVTAISSSTDRHVLQQSADFSSSSKSYDRLGHRAKEKLLDREFFLSLLSSASTKREAKQYLARFKAGPRKASPKPAIERPIVPPPPKEIIQSGVNLGSFYGASRSVYDSPVFRVDPTPVRPEEFHERLHLALVKITTPQILDDHTIDGVAKTLSQLNRLGMSCCVVLDPGSTEKGLAARKVAIEQADRLSVAVDGQPDSKSVRLDSILSVSATNPSLPRVFSRKSLLSPLRDGQTVIVTPVAYTEDSPKAVAVSANDVVLALTKEFAGLATFPDPDEDPLVTAERIDGLQKEVSLDRVIVLDPLGGIPAFLGPQQSHVFINMEQEYDDIKDELLRVKQTAVAENGNQSATEKATPPANSQPVSEPSFQQDILQAEGYSSALDGHLENLRLSQRALAMLPSGSSGIITSPKEVASSANAPQASPDLSAVGTRRQRNPLIHNLLTDKPMLSSSLPPRRRGPMKWSPGLINQPTAHTTFVKRGMPLTMFPNPSDQAWSARNKPRVRLDDPCIDLPRLVHLIEDSFNRKLDVQDYLNRINNRIAGLIIAGEYEGGAILTWEPPPGVEDDGSDESVARMVPYLDKFAVLKRSQGAGGVADIVFNAMVRTCFPNGVCWRSRKDNPVNKWYFERSLGTWKLSDSNWTMFWTTPGLPEDGQKFRDYEAVCRSIQPSWADHKSVVD